MQIRWTEPAVEDLTQICNHTLESRGPEAANRLAVRIFEAVEDLGRFPKRGREGRKPGTRELPLPDLPFVVIYRLRADAVEVTRILHGARRWP